MENNKIKDYMFLRDNVIYNVSDNKIVKYEFPVIIVDNVSKTQITNFQTYSNKFRLKIIKYSNIKPEGITNVLLKNSEENRLACIDMNMNVRTYYLVLNNPYEEIDYDFNSIIRPNFKQSKFNLDDVIQAQL
ncbi:MAG: hypothetical protein PHN56_04500 [Candidatus Nanoarchaeia archaeon]|nr:hypothetical protein [Candidatus Nanoarchaeia archaeon]